MYVCVYVVAMYSIRLLKFKVHDIITGHREGFLQVYALYHTYDASIFVSIGRGILH